MLNAVVYELPEVPEVYWDFAKEYGTIYQSRPYCELLVDNNIELIVVAVYDDDDIVGGAAITLGKRILGLAGKASMYFGPIVKDKEIIGDVLNCVVRSIKNYSWTISVSIWPDHVDNLINDIRRQKWKKTYIEFLHWDISPSLEALWKELPKGKRSSVNRARREKVSIIEIDTDEHLKQFYDLHNQSMTRGEDVSCHSFSFYKCLFDIFKPKGLVTGYLALHPETQEAIAAVVLLFGMDTTATYMAVGHNYEHRKLGGSDLLVWHCLELLKARGFTLFDLVGLPQGDTNRAKGIRHFKTAWSGSNGYCLPSFIMTYNCHGINVLGVFSSLKSLRASVARCVKIVK